MVILDFMKSCSLNPTAAGSCEFTHTHRPQLLLVASNGRRPSSGRRLPATQRPQSSSGRMLPASASSQRPQDPSDRRFPATTKSYYNSGRMLSAAAPNPCHPAAATPCYPAAASSQPPSSRRLLVAADSQRPQSPSDCRLPATEDTQRLQARVVACACSRRPQPLRATQRLQPCRLEQALDASDGT